MGEGKITDKDQLKKKYLPLIVDQLKKGALPQSLKPRLAKMGFAGVEFAGYHKYSGKAKELRKKLDELKLAVAPT